MDADHLWNLPASVPAERPSVRAMARTLEPLWLMLAIVMRSSG